MGATIKDCQNLVELAFEKRREVHMQVQAAKKAVKSRLMFNAIEDAEISVTCKEIQDSSLFDVVASDLATEQETEDFVKFTRHVINRAISAVNAYANQNQNGGVEMFLSSPI